MVDFKKTDKTAFIARNITATPGTYIVAGTVSNPTLSASPESYMVRVDMPASGTIVGWINPHAGQVVVSDVLVHFVTAGTGTIDVGTGTSGTGASSVIIDGGTMAAVAYQGGFGATLGDLRSAVVLAGSGTVADSVTVTHDEAATGTAVGTLLFRVTVL